MRALTLDDLETIARAAAGSGQPDALFRAVDAAALATLGHKGFSISRLNRERLELTRLHSSLPEVYRVGGSKQKRGTLFAERVLIGCEPSLADGPAAVRQLFDDHEVILALGVSAVLNFPVVFDGACIATMNLMHDQGHYTARAMPIGRVLAAQLIPAVLRGHGS